MDSFRATPGGGRVAIEITFDALGLLLRAASEGRRIWIDSIPGSVEVIGIRDPDPIARTVTLIVLSRFSARSREDEPLHRVRVATDDIRDEPGPIHRLVYGEAASHAI